MDTVRVVVADDNVQLRDMIVEYLQAQNGIEIVGAASDGVEALRLVTEFEPESWFAISSAADGWLWRSGKAASHEAAKQPGVIALTALGRDDFISRADQSGRQLLYGQAV